MAFSQIHTVVITEEILEKIANAQFFNASSSFGKILTEIEYQKGGSVEISSNGGLIVYGEKGRKIVDPDIVLGIV